MSTGTIVAVVFLIAAVVLLAIAAIAEAGIISLSRSRARLLASRQPGDKRARRLREITRHRERALGSVAVGRTLAVGTAFTAAFAITVSEIGDGWRELLVTGVIAVLAAALIQAVPRRLAAAWPEAFAMLFVPVIDLFDAAFLIPAAALESPARLFTRLRADQTELAPAPTDLELVLESGPDPIEEDEREMIRGVMSIGERVVREAMTPRPDVTAVQRDTPAADVLDEMLASGYSRIPVYDDSIDHITGIVYAKDLMAAIRANRGDRPVTLAAVRRDPMLVPESKLIDELLAEFQRSRTHMAIVLDEYGGTAGLITLEDLIEEIIGEIADEHDAAPPAEVTELEDGALLLGGRAPLSALEPLGLRPDQPAEFDTVAGWVFDRLGKIPDVGDEVTHAGISVIVQKMDGRRIAQMRAAPISVNGAAAATADD